MTVIVTDEGFSPDTWDLPFVPLAEARPGTLALDVPSDTDPAALHEFVEHALMIRIDFPAFSDGRGFTLARQLRLMGYRGRLRARGHVIADQYAMARRSGFDEVEIGDDLARRQPQEQWLSRARWREHDYQFRLGRRRA